jgi:hypothetical protein
MLGAWLPRHLPGATGPSSSIERAEQGLFLLWLAYMGLLLFGAGLLWEMGAWHRLLEADPTRLTLVIVALFVGSSLWAGRRAWQLGRERQALASLSVAQGGTQAQSAQGWAAAYLYQTRQGPEQGALALQLLGERAHGPHEMAWWLNGIQLKLGLLGKVIGFSILALQLGQVEQFDASQSGQLLRDLTGGLGIALLTTVTGLTGNILLGLQLMRLDRFADALVADAIAAALPTPPTPESEGPDGDRPPGS